MAGANRPAARKADDTQAQQTATAEAAAVEGSDTTTDYTRRAGGWVLTDRGWVIEDQTDAEAPAEAEQAEGVEQK